MVTVHRAAAWTSPSSGPSSCTHRRASRRPCPAAAAMWSGVSPLASASTAVPVASGQRTSRSWPASKGHPRIAAWCIRLAPVRAPRGGAVPAAASACAHASSCRLSSNDAAQPKRSAAAAPWKASSIAAAGGVAAATWDSRSARALPTAHKARVRASPSRGFSALPASVAFTSVTTSGVVLHSRRTATSPLPGWPSVPVATPSVEATQAQPSQPLGGSSSRVACSPASLACTPCRYCPFRRTVHRRGWVLVPGPVPESPWTTKVSPGEVDSTATGACDTEAVPLTVGLRTRAAWRWRSTPPLCWLAMRATQAGGSSSSRLHPGRSSVGVPALPSRQASRVSSVHPGVMAPNSWWAA